MMHSLGTYQPKLHTIGFPRGSVLVLAALLIVFIVGFAAFCVDLGFLQLVKGELQNSADAGALAGAASLLSDDLVKTPPKYDTAHERARNQTAEFVLSNKAASRSLHVQANPRNESAGDVVIGYLSDPTDPTSGLDFSDPLRFNAVQVRVKKTAGTNGLVPSFFSRLWGNQGTSTAAAATAVVSSSVVGFKATPETGNAKLLPIALDVEDWKRLINDHGDDDDGDGDDDDKYKGKGKGKNRDGDSDDNGNGTDDFAVSSDGTVSAGNDGILELRIFPLANSSSGNFGTVKIGDRGGGTADLSRQILEGVNTGDFQEMGGSLQLGADGTLQLSGDTGISAGMKNELDAIKGQQRIIFLYSTVTGHGANATYTIVGFLGVRVVDVKLTGALSEKKLVVQPSVVVDDTAIIGNTPNQSKYVYTNARLAR